MTTDTPSKHDRWILIRGARQLLTMRSARGPQSATEAERLGVIPDGAVLIHNGVISAVGPTRRVENLTHARNAGEINAAGRIVMPAFLDPHTYPVPPAGAVEEGYGKIVASRIVHALPASRLQAQFNHRAKIMARHGTATIGALSGYGFDDSGELKILRVLKARHHRPLDIVPVVNMIGPSPEEPSGASESRTLQTSPGFLATVAKRKLARAVCVRCGRDGASLPAAVEFLQQARELCFKLRVEIQPEHDPALIPEVLRLGALSAALSGPLQSGEIAALAHSATVPIVLPGVDSSICRELIENGAYVALASAANPENGGSMNMAGVVEMAMDHSGLTLTEALLGATLHAARALGLGAKSGSLEYGKLADVILLNVSDYHEIPLVPRTNLTYSMLKRGMLLFEEEFAGWPEDS